MAAPSDLYFSPTTESQTQPLVQDHTRASIERLSFQYSQAYRIMLGVDHYAPIWAAMVDLLCPTVYFFNLQYVYNKL